MTRIPIGKLIREARKKSEKTQEKVAWEIGISREHYARMEGNKVNITKENIAKLENLFEMEISSEIFEDFDRKIEALSNEALKKLKKCPPHKAVILLKNFNTMIDLIMN